MLNIQIKNHSKLSWKRFRGIFQNTKPMHVVSTYVWKLYAGAQSVCNERMQNQTLALNINICRHWNISAL